MRLRNVKNASLILNNSKYFIANPKEYRGSFNKLFGNEFPIMVEIGMGKGDFIKNMALRHPDWNFLGIEKYESVLVRGVEKLNDTTLENVRVMCIDAKEIDEYLSHEVDTLYLNFSDPWPKTRHHKRRLTHESFLSLYDKIFKNDCHIVLKTDNDSLFAFSLVSLNNYGYKFEEVILDLWNSDKENVRTEYEEKFGNMGFKIKYLDAYKKLEVERNQKR